MGEQDRSADGPMAFWVVILVLVGAVALCLLMLESLPLGVAIAGLVLVCVVLVCLPIVVHRLQARGRDR